MSEPKVYFEKQGSGRLCGVHCLNSLLQGPIFTQSDLNKYAADLDKEEAALLAADPSKPPPARTMTISSLANQPKSDNVDSTGYFSLSVLERALKAKFGLSVENAARREVFSEIKTTGFQNHDGFVIHLRDHWFSVRAVNRIWFFLDSLKQGPEQVSENDLWGTLQGLIQSGNHVFAIRGPDGQPGRLPATPPNTRYLAPNQFYLPSAEIHKKSDGTTSFAVSEKKQTDWGTLGQGQSLAAQTEDEKLQAVIAASLRPVVSLPEEPPTGPSVVTVMIRSSNGRKVRRFSIDSPLALLWQWVWEWSPTATALVGPAGLRLVPTNKEDDSLVSSVLQGGEQVMFNLA